VKIVQERSATNMRFNTLDSVRFQKLDVCFSVPIKLFSLTEIKCYNT